MNFAEARAFSRLRDEADELRAQLSEALSRDTITRRSAVAVGMEWGLTRGEAKLLAYLVVLPLAHYDAIAITRDTIRVLVFRMRPKLAARGIRIYSRWGEGLYLDAAVRARMVAGDWEFPVIERGGR